jgi:hypothetical protein
MRDFDQGDGVIFFRRIPVVVVRVKGDCGRVAVREQCVPTGRAEIDPLWIPMPTVVTEHGDHGTPTDDLSSQPRMAPE